ncbi:hypothetical protein DPM17_03710 [Polynucleobacter paneuropaeus]|uniref:WYL domain-containing protein n=1 Tax=Polynucleobacter paneuropaeus TaxID=2527775 RepID=UPI000DBF0CCD|nr:WYL domain-containing protein [Polynucleobacter paneuropaeus]AWW47836.1 hypothetical protein DPM17_03710 [Polynucleobacter paneuropaeus]
MTIFFIIAALVGLYLYFKEDSKDGPSNYSNSTNASGKEKPYSPRGRGPRNKNYESKSDGNKRIIDDALLKGSEITFKYIDRVGAITYRRVTPKRIFMYQLEESDGQMLCMESYCHLRKSNRTFALFRMEDICLTK